MIVKNSNFKRQRSLELKQKNKARTTQSGPNSSNSKAAAGKLTSQGGVDIKGGNNSYEYCTKNSVASKAILQM